MNPIVLAVALAAVALQVACTQAGETDRATRSAGAPEAPVCAPDTTKDCVPAPPVRPQDPGLQPAVPPVPKSPLKLDCARLPTQVERDTCTNRKQSTG